MWSKDSQSFSQTETWQLYCLLGKGVLAWGGGKVVGLACEILGPNLHSTLCSLLGLGQIIVFHWGSVSIAKKWSKHVVRLKCFMKVTLEMLSDTDNRKSKETCRNNNIMSSCWSSSLMMSSYPFFLLGSNWPLIIMWALVSHLHSSGELAGFLYSLKEGITWGP